MNRETESEKSVRKWFSVQEILPVQKHTVGSSALQCATAQTSGYSRHILGVFVISKNIPNTWLIAVLKTFEPAAQKKKINKQTNTNQKHIAQVCRNVMKQY